MVESIARQTGKRAAGGRRLAGGAQGRARGRLRARCSWMAALLGALLLSGCGNFFAKSTTTTTPTTPVTGAGDFLYIANANPVLDTVAGYSLASAALTATSGSPYQLGVSPSTIAITPTNSFLYVGSELGGIYGYTVGSNGVLTRVGSSIVSSAGASVMAVDSTGTYLLVLELGTTNPSLSAFPINTSTGTLSNATSTVTLDTGVPRSMLLVPNSTLIYVSLQTGGVDALTFDSSTGTLAKLSILLNPSVSDYSDNGLATDPAGQFLYVAETGINGVRSFTIDATTGGLTPITGSPTSAGGGTGALLVDSTGTYLYAANRVASTISAFSISATDGSLTEVTGSPFATGSVPLQMAEDNTKGYLAVVCSGGTPDLQLFSINATTGALVSAVKQSTGSVSPAVATAIVASH